MKCIINFLYLLFILTLWFISLFFGCRHEEENHDEIGAMNTVCIDGKLKLSVIVSGKCYYHPLEINGEEIDCNAKKNDML
jgi:hypothetical protein